MPVIEPRCVSERFFKIHLLSNSIGLFATEVFQFHILIFYNPFPDICNPALVPGRVAVLQIDKLIQEFARLLIHPEKKSKHSNRRFLSDSICHSRLRLTIYSGQWTKSRSNCIRVVVDSGEAVYYPQGYKGKIGAKIP